MATYKDKILVLIDAKSDGAVREMKDLQSQTGKTESGFDRLGKKIGVTGATIKGALVAGAAAFVGTGLVGFLQDSVSAFTEAQDAAAQFARATNATVEEAGKFTSVARTLGLEMNDLIEINAEFANKIEEQPELLDQLNVQVAKNADGSTNMTRTLVATIDALGQMEDGLEAAKIAADLFGEEGSKQLAGFYLQGIKVSDLMDRIDFLDQSDQAKAFAAATIEMELAMQQLQIRVGAYLVPALTALADAGSDVIGFLSQVPSEVYLVVGSAVLLSRVLKTDLAVVAFGAVGRGAAVMAASLLSPRLGFQLLGVAATNASNTIKAAFLSNPLTLSLAALTGWFTLLSIGTGRVKDSAEELAPRLRELKESLPDAEALSKVTSEWERSAGVWERIAASARGTDWYEFFLGPLLPAKILADAFRDGGNDVEYFDAQVSAAEQGLTEYELVTKTATQAQGDLNEQIAELVNNGGPGAASTWRDIAAAAAEAAESQRKQEEITRLTAEALAIAAGDAGYFIDKLRELETFDNSGMEALKESLIGITLVDDPSTAWVNEYIIGAERAADAIYNELSSALEATPDLDISGWFASLRAGAPPEIAAIIDQVESAVNSDGGIRAALGIQDDGTLATTRTELDALGNPIQAPFDLITGDGLAAAQGQKDTLAEPVETDITFNTGFDPGGYNAVRSRKDYLAQQVNASLAINVQFGPDGYSAAKARKDYLAQNRTAYIDVITRYSSTGTPPSQGDSDSASGSAASAINFIRVQLDGRDLKAVIRDEVGSLTPIRQAVA